MNMKRIVCSAMTLILLLSVSACSTAAPAAVQGTPDLNATVAMSVALAQTIAAAQTQTAIALDPNLTVPTSTNTPQITLTSTLANTPTPNAVYMTINKDTNCRTGSNSAFPAITTIKAGTRVEVLGVNPSEDTYFVTNPDRENSYCWAWGRYGTIEGDTTTLPVFTPQPTPTPTRTPTPVADFAVSFVNVQNCGSDYSFKIYIKNLGGSTLQYVYITMTDASTSTTFTHSSNSFVEYTGCSVSVEQGDLVQGESANVTTYNPGQFNYSPYGHSVDVSVMVCTADNMAGTCVTKSFNVSP